MKCPHCFHSIHDDYDYERFATASDGYWFIVYRFCPECDGIIIDLVNALATGSSYDPIRRPSNVQKNIRVWPKGSQRPPCPSEVPDTYAKDYTEACLVLPDSPKASAALSRRCLQNILREVAGVKASDLSHEIQEVIDSKTLPSYIIEIIDAVRVVGNFAAHPIKSQQSGQIIEVGEGEAELNLDVLEALFDFYFVQPTKIAEKKKIIDQKLQDAGKPPMK